MTLVLAVATTTVVGLMVGAELAVAFVVGPIARRLPADASIAARADAARLLGRVMPVWYTGSTILAAAFTAVAWGTTAAPATLTAVALLGLSVVMSLVLLVPINDRAATWTVASHPTDWREQLQRWDHLHHGRVGILAAAFVLVAVAATSV